MGQTIRVYEQIAGGTHFPLFYSFWKDVFICYKIRVPSVHRTGHSPDPGAPMATGALGGVVLILIAMLLCLAFAGISLAIGATVKEHETFFAIVNFLTMPLLFLSSALFPADFMPGWLRIAVAYNPVTYAIDPMRALMITGWNWAIIIPGVTVVGVFALFMGGLATFLFRRSVA